MVTLDVLMEGQDWVGLFFTNSHHCHYPSHLSSAYCALCAFTCINSLHTLLVLGVGASFPSFPPKSRSDHGDPRVIARLRAGIDRLVVGEVNCVQGEHQGQ